MTILKRFAVLLFIALVSACQESAQTITFEPGVYKGADDPLLGQVDTAALESRFANQKDR